MTIRVSTSSRSVVIPCSAWVDRRLPSKENGRVTTPMVSAPSARATRATTGAPPVPVPPPSPAGQVATDVELDVGVAHQQGLGVGVHRDELHAAQPSFDHAVDRIDAAAADPHNLDDGQIVL